MNKCAKQENFPVEKLVKPSLRPVVAAYYAAARQADDIADNPQLSTAEKLAQLDEMAKDFYTRGNSTAGRLGQIFATENLDNSLYADLLEAFRRDAKGNKIEIWEQLLDYCRYSAAPVGRFILALYNENPAAYLPAETLCAVLQIANHLQDLKADACRLNRCYLPQELLDKYNVIYSDLYLSFATPQLRALLTEVAARLQSMLQDTEILLNLVQSRRLKIQIGIIFSLTNCMLKKIIKIDIIATPARLNRLNWLAAAISGTWRGILARTKTCSNSPK